MASKLASQLQALAVAGGGPTYSRPSTRPSLLFHPSQAADIDVQTIFTLSQTGLDELVTMDGRFKAFRKTLFSLEGSHLDRELQSKEFNDKLNKSIGTFLRLLSGYVMLTSAHQILEYLIRRHKIQVYNVEDVVLCVLPYHETSLFVRVVQLLQIQNTRWQFLEAVQETGAALPRTVLVQRCTNDMAILEPICALGMSVSGIAAKSKTTISFVSVVLVETLAEVPTMSTDLVNKILPFILQSFENGIAEEYRVGALMIIGALANRTALALSLVETLFHHISRAFQKGSETDGISVLQLHIMVIIQLVQTQQIHAFPSKPFKTLVKVRDFIPILTDLVKVYNTQKFLALLVQALVAHCFQHEHYEHALLDAIKFLPVKSQVAPSVLRLLEIAFGEGDGSQVEAPKSKFWLFKRHKYHHPALGTLLEQIRHVVNLGPSLSNRKSVDTIISDICSVVKSFILVGEGDVVKKLLQALEKQFPVELDKAITLHFQNSKETHKRKMKEDPVFIFLSDVFHGSLRAPLAETHMSLYLSLDHPQASIRETAIRQLSQLASTVESTEGAEIYAVLREAYLRQLNDSDYHVIRAALSADNLVKVLPAECLFQALASIISRCNAELTAGERSSKQDVKTISKLAIELLASEFVVQHPGYVEQVAFVFFNHLLQRPLTWRLNKIMLKAAGTLPFHLFTDLANVFDETPSGTNEEGLHSKEKRKLWQAAVNGKIIKSLAAKVSDDSSALLPLLHKTSLSDDSKFMVALVLLQCFRQHSEGLNSNLIDASLQWLRDEWTTIGSGKNLPLTDLQMIDYTKWDDSNSTPPGFYDQPEVKPTTAYSELLLRTLHKLVTCVPSYNSSQLESDGGQDLLNELFVLFAGSSSMKIFSPHIDLLKNHLSAPEILPFFSKFFTAEGSAVPAFVQVHSLDVLASHLLNIARLEPKAVDHIMYTQLQTALPPLLVALASPLKAVRRSSSYCVEHLSNAWDKHSLGKGGAKVLDTPLLHPICYGKILHILVGARATIISSGTYLEELFRENYGPTEKLDEEAKMRDADELQSIVTFFVNHAFHLTDYGQRVVFKVLQGMAHGSELVRATHERRSELLEQRKLAHLQSSSDTAFEKLTQAEIQLLEVLSQMYTSRVPGDSSQAPGADVEDLLSSFFDCLRVEGGSMVDPAVLQPCTAALKCLTPDFYSALSSAGQDIAFQALISLSTANNESLRSTARGALRKIKISASTVARHLDHLLEDRLKGSAERKKKKRKASGEEKIVAPYRWLARGKMVTTTSTILELLMWKTDMEERQVLLIPLFKLLKNVVNGIWPQMESEEEHLTGGTAAKEGDISQSAAVLNAQHLIFMTLDNIVRSLTKEVVDKKELISLADFDVDIVVTSVTTAADGTTRNHALALLTSLGRLIPDAVLTHLIDVLSVVGESTLTQDDSHSHQVVYHMLTAVVPGWLAIEKDPTALLQVFVSTLPRIPVHRRMAAITNLLRVTTEEVGLHIFLFLLLRKASTGLRNYNPLPEDSTENGCTEVNRKLCESLELEFAASFCRQYSPSVKLPAMVKLLDIAKVENFLHSDGSPDSVPRQELSDWAIQQLATEFVTEQLQSSEVHIQAQVTDRSNTLQKSFVAIMEQVLLQLQNLSAHYFLPLKTKKGVQEAAVSLLDGLNIVMASTEYLRGISSMMNHSDPNIRRRVLRMYISKIKELDRSTQVAQSKKKQLDLSYLEDEHLTPKELELRIGIVNVITDLVAGKGEADNAGSVFAAIEALNASAQKFAVKMPSIFVSSLPALVANGARSSRARTAAAVRCISTIIRKIGPHALPALPDTVSALLEMAKEAMEAPGVGDPNLGRLFSDSPVPLPETEDDHDKYYSERDIAAQAELRGAILDALEAMLDKLGAFLTPYLQRIVDLVLLQPQLFVVSNFEIITRAAALRTLLPTKIPARLLLDPLLSAYESAIEMGEDSTCALFDMLGAMTTKADRSSVAAYHGRIFEFCLIAFDLRGKGLSTLQSISRVETAVMNALISLVMKLSETTFKPLFIKILEWAESETEVDGSFVSHSVDRNIVLYKLVNLLSSKLRSVFVPYLQYLINGCVHHLANGLSDSETLKPRKKKKKKQGVNNEKQKVILSPSEWHLRQLILSSLHQCFLYDTIGFLDATKFQLLLGPVVSQLLIEAPTEVATLKEKAETADLPSLQEMDDTLVSCLGQMALTAGTDLLWKPLNHEVLMCTRVENMRTRLLGLRVVKFLAEHLKEEYLVLLPETIPFLGELLEDTELAVVAKTQEIVKFLEDLSGEDLAQYF